MQQQVVPVPPTSLETLPIGACVTDAAGRVTYLNQIASNIWQEPPTTFIHTIDTTSDVDVVAPDGTKKTYQVTSSAFDAQAEQVAVLHMLTDVTARVDASKNLERLADEAMVSNKIKNQFIMVMSHEMRTPLTAILGFAELLRSSKLGEKERGDYSARIERSGKQLLGIVKDLLDISKLEAGKLALELNWVSPLKVVNEAVELVHAEAEKKSLPITTTFAADVPENLYIDATRLRQILLNLLSNAVKFTEKGSIKLDVAYEPHSDEVAFHVTDSGVGISGHEHQHLFKPFHQITNPLMRKPGGTGLGLFLSRKLTAAFGGTLVLAKSSLGEGATFSLRFPVSELAKRAQKLPNQTTTLPTPAPAAPTGGGKDQPLSGRHILVAEDTPDNQVLIVKILTEAGCKVDLVVNGAEALAKIDVGHYDLVLMDVQMPIMDGLTATKKMRAKGWNGPIVALTAFAMDEHRRQSANAGFTAHVSKPVSRRVLIESLLTHLR